MGAKALRLRAIRSDRNSELAFEESANGNPTIGTPMEVSASRLGQPNKNMNRINDKLYTDKYLLANRWVSKSESYRDAARIAAAYGHNELKNFYLCRMRFWSLSAATHIKKIK